jgi:hypothetical protein
MHQSAIVLPLGPMWAVRADFQQNGLPAFGTEAEAVHAARTALFTIGGGELVVKDRGGRIIHSERFPSA